MTSVGNIFSNGNSAVAQSIPDQNRLPGEKYVREKGGNDAPLTYQEASGAPVENDSPLGYAVGPATITLLNITDMIGTGIYSTPSAILSGTGSTGLSLIFWVLGYLMSLASGAVYLEFTAYFPSRSGSEVVFLEQAFPSPAWFFPTTFAVQSVLLSFGSSNAVVLAKYLIAISGHAGTDWQVKGVAWAGYTLAALCLSFNTRYAYMISNAISLVKITTLIFIIITGFVVFGGHTSVPNPKANFRDSFNGTSSVTAYGITNALYRIIFSYSGYETAFNVVNEVKNPVVQLKKYSTLALTIVFVLYMFTNVAWLSAVPKDKLENADVNVASLFFRSVFGNSAAVRGLNFLIALSAFGNLMGSMIKLSRKIRESGRQGVLPCTNFWVSTKPFGTPIGPFFCLWFLTTLMILAVPAGDAFNFVSDLSIMPHAVFNLAMAIGLYLVRWRRKKAGLPEPAFKAWHIVVMFHIFVQLYLVTMPWYPPEGGAYAGDVSFWYATYILTGIGILLLCGIYYWLWAFVIPKWRGYKLRPEIIDLGNGAKAHQIRKVLLKDLDKWDANHDDGGHLRETVITGVQIQETGGSTQSNVKDSEKSGRI